MEGSVLDLFRVLSLVVAWAIPGTLAMLVVVFAVAAPAFIAAGVILRLHQVLGVRRQGTSPGERRSLELACSVDGDCPPGFMCIDGVCVSMRT
ncbi:MAG: hypothetical protein HYX92_19310 [Chloroflexi bacterium]|nr:hypothetical protein [Chloroflexota bacterium]